MIPTIGAPTVRPWAMLSDGVSGGSIWRMGGRSGRDTSGNSLISFFPLLSRKSPAEYEPPTTTGGVGSLQR